MVVWMEMASRSSWLVELFGIRVREHGLVGGAVSLAMGFEISKVHIVPKAQSLSALHLGVSKC